MSAPLLCRLNFNDCFFILVLLEIAALEREYRLLEMIHMLDTGAEQAVQIRSLLFWQAGAVIIVSTVVFALFSGSLSVLYGGCLTMLSTWHVYKSVYASGGNRAVLLQSAGLRFVVFLAVLGVGVVFLGMQPLYMVAGMAISYVALYVRSLLMIFKQMKGEDVG